MSGGSRNYMYHNIDEYYSGRMYDKELDDMMKDISDLTRAVEWYESGDTCEETYREAVKKFKDKWFKQSRSERLKGYIDGAVSGLKTELYEMILTALVPLLRMNGENVKRIEAVRDSSGTELAELEYDSGNCVYVKIGYDSNLAAVYDILRIVLNYKPDCEPDYECIGEIQRGIYPLSRERG